MDRYREDNGRVFQAVSDDYAVSRDFGEGHADE